MRMLAVTGFLVILAALALTRSAAADDPAPTPIPSITVHVDITAKVAATINNKMAVGDKCRLADIKLAKNGTYTVNVVDTASDTGVRAAGVLEERLPKNVDIKALEKVTWTIAEGDKGRGKNIITLTTTETIPTQN